MLGVDTTLHVNKDGFARADVTFKTQSQTFQCHRLARHSHQIVTTPHAQGANAKGVTKREQAMPCNQSNDGIRAFDALVYPTHRSKYIGRR